MPVAVVNPEGDQAAEGDIPPEGDEPAELPSHTEKQIGLDEGMMRLDDALKRRDQAKKETSELMAKPKASAEASACGFTDAFSKGECLKILTRICLASPISG